MFRSAALACVTAAVLVGCGGNGDAGGNGTSAKTGTEPVSAADDQHRAELALLTLSDLGSGWETYDLSQDPVVAGEINCFGFDDAGLVSTAQVFGEAFAIGGPTYLVAGKVFVRGSHVVASSATVFETEKQAETAFTRLVDSFPTEPVARCLLQADTVRKGPRMAHINSAFYPVDKGFSGIAEQTWVQQYEIRIAKNGGTVWLHLVVMREERAFGIAFFSSVEVPQLVDPIGTEFVKLTAESMGERLAP
jgi:hypothetical protein